MTIKNTFLLTSIHTVIKIVAGIIMNKIIAVYLGPSGLAMIGQFQNFSQLMINIATGSINTGIVKYTSENKENKEKLFVYWNNSLYISLFFSFIIISTILIFNSEISEKVLFSDEYSGLITIFALSMIFYVLNMYILSIINGLQNIKLFTMINIFISLLTLIIVIFLTIEYKLMGALYALVITQSFVLVISLIFIYKKYKFDFFTIRTLRNYDTKIVKNLLSYGLVSFVSGVSMSVMLLTVRYIIETDASLIYAGYWESLWKISTYFTMLSMLPASIYYLPKYAELETIIDIKNKLLESVKFFFPLQIFFGIILFIFKLYIIELLFTDEFIIIAPVLAFMIIGDIVRVIAYLIVNIMYAKGFILKLVILDISYNIFLIILVYFLFKEYSLIGLGYSYLVANIFVLIYVLKFYFNIEELIIKKDKIVKK